jgi:hypothetical protein
MADKHSYTVKLENGDTYDIDSDHELTDAEAEQHARDQAKLEASQHIPTHDEIMQRNETARANMAKQANAGGGPSQWSASEVGSRALQGAKGELEGAAGAVAAPALMLYQGVRHPINSAKYLGGAAMLAGEGIKDAATMPGETAAALKDAAMGIASDPEALGGIAGGIMGAEAAGPAFRAARNTRIGQAVNRAAESAPIVGPVVKVVSPSAKTLEGDFASAMAQRDAKAAADAAYAARLNPPAPKPPVVKIAKPTARAAAAAAEEARLNANGVVSNADAAASNPAAAMPERRLPMQGETPQSPLTRTPEQLDAAQRAELVKQAEERFGVKPPVEGDVAVHPAPPGAQLPVQGAGTESFNDQPLYKQQPALLNAPDNTPLGPGRMPEPTHEQLGGRGTGMESPESKALKAKQALKQQADTIQLVNEEGPTTTNGSGQGAGSREENARLAAEKTTGKYTVITKNGEVVRPISEGTSLAEGANTPLKPGESIGIVHMNPGEKAPIAGMRIGARTFEPQGHGTKFGNVSHYEMSQYGNRGAGAVGGNSTFEQRIINARAREALLKAGKS